MTGGLLAGLAVWTLASTAWAPSAEAAFNEFNRVSLYLGGVHARGARGNARQRARWADGLGLGIVVTGSSPSRPPLSAPVRHARTRGRFCRPRSAAQLSRRLLERPRDPRRDGFPLACGGRLAGRDSAHAQLALVPLPALRGGDLPDVVARRRRGALLGSLAFLAVTNRRWAAVGALFASGIASVLAIGVLLRGTRSSTGPQGSSAARSPKDEALRC